MRSGIVQAMAAHNTGGIVIVQVEHVVASGSLPPRLVHIPGAIVDKVSPCVMLGADVLLPMQLSQTQTARASFSNQCMRLDMCNTCKG